MKKKAVFKSTEINISLDLKKKKKPDMEKQTKVLQTQLPAKYLAPGIYHQNGIQKNKTAA